MGIRRKKYLIDEIKALGKYSCVGGPFGSSLTQAHYVDFKAVPVIRGANLTNDEFQDAGFVYVSEEKGNELNKNMAFPGDIVFTQRGTLGQVALIPTNAKFSRYVVSQSQMKLTVNPDIADAYFIYSYFRSKSTKKHIESNAIVGGVPHINLGILKNIEIELPPLEVQKKIVGVLRGLDDKITLNRQINQTLEQMAQTLFKSWFVDFDPVIDNALDAGNAIPDTLQERAEQRRLLRAKADFKPLPAATRALFPSEFEETELGWVPKGWEVKNLGELVTVKRGGSPRPIQDFLVPEGLPWVKISDATASDSRFLSTTKEFIKPEGLNKTVLLQKGELILSNSATPGLPKFLELDACIHDGWLYFPEKRHISDLYLYQLFLEIRPLLVQQGNGSVFTNLKTDILKQHSMVVPTSNVLRSFEKQVFAFHSKIQQVNQENQNLQKIRDILLPQLISGELALDDLPEIPSP